MQLTEEAVMKRKNGSKLEGASQLVEEIEIQIIEVKLTLESHEKKPEELDLVSLEELVKELKNIAELTKNCGEALQKLQDKFDFVDF